MHKILSNVYLHPEIIEQIETACGRLDVNKSLFLNVLLKELFEKAQPEDLFYNRVKVTDLDNKIDRVLKKADRITQ
ncbi:hypothetical protein [Maridesulfovibrio ferrireducens]|uniref:hypothetical protein n=1 Tax=Maridesulfovibrio ferrireducens TaxID=246191 RepID=UPI001A2906A2|nr:hypothetical protein [Maridesulfovibrio ferrireducens]MBI9110489.1 hypothetical protein [Maridesulfovibrio ferrireducens]